MSTFIIADATNNITISQDGVIIETIAKEAVVLQIVLSGEALNKSNVDELWIQHDGKYSTEIPYTSATVVSDTPSSVEDFRQKVLVLLNANAIYTGGGAPLFPIEITRATAITMNAANGGNGSFIDGQLYRITNPLTPLSSVTAQAIKDKDGHPRLLTSGKAFTTTSPNVELEVGYNALTNEIKYVNQPSQRNFISGSPTAYSLFDYTEPTAINNTIRDCFVSMGGGTLNFYSNNTAIGSSIVLNNAELSGSLLTANSSVSITGTSYLTSFVYLSKFRNANLTLTSDSEVDGCSFENITIAGSGIELTNCTFIGNGETITFPTGYTATGKTFISGVSSNFEYELYLDDGVANYNSTAAADGYGVLTIPANLQWVGVFILTNEFAHISEIANFDPWCHSATFQADATSLKFYLNIMYQNTSTTDQIERQFLYQLSIITGTVGLSVDWTSSTDYAVVEIKKFGEKNILMFRVKCVGSNY